MNLSAIVLAAGQSKRMKTDVSKVLHRLQGKTVIGHVYESLRRSGIRKVITVASRDNIEGLKKEAGKIGISSRFVIQKKQRGTADAVREALKVLRQAGSSVLITSGDMPLVSRDTYKNLIRKFLRTRSSCTLLTGEVSDAHGYGRIIRRSKEILGIKEEKDLAGDEGRIKEINAGVYVFRTQPLKKLLPCIRNVNRQKEYYLTDIISLFKKSGLAVSTVSVSDPDEIQGINNRNDLSRLMAILWKWKSGTLMRQGVTIEDPETTFIDSDVRVGRDTVIKPFTIIESGTRIGRRCVIGPFSHIRNQALIMDTAEIGNFVEVKKSVVKPGAKAKHLAYLGDATVGRKTNIGAGTITANFDGKNKFPTVIGDECYIGSNTVLIAPLKLGKRVKTGSGAIVTRNQVIPSGSLLVGVPAKIVKRTS